MIAVLVMAAGTAGCGDDGTGPRAISEEEPVEGLSFEASVDAGSGRLAISYRLHNGSGRTLLVLNRVPVREEVSRDKLQSDPGRVYVTNRGGGLVEVAKRAFKKPKGLNLNAPYVFDATVLAAGRALEERFEVPLPLEGRSVYPGADGDLSELPDRPERVVFCLGIAPAGDRPIGSNGDVFHTGHDVLGQRLLCSDEVPLS